MFGTNSVTYSIPHTAKYLLEIQRNSIGLDEWFKKIDTAFESNSNYPPHNLVKEDNTNFRLELALAGYDKRDIEVTTEWNKLHIHAKKVENSEGEYLHKGIAKRAFTRTFILSEDVSVGSVSFKNGLLIIKLNKVIPEDKRKVYDII